MTSRTVREVWRPMTPRRRSRRGRRAQPSGRFQRSRPSAPAFRGRGGRPEAACRGPGPVATPGGRTHGRRQGDERRCRTGVRGGVSRPLWPGERRARRARRPRDPLPAAGGALGMRSGSTRHPRGTAAGPRTASPTAHRVRGTAERGPNRSGPVRSGPVRGRVPCPLPTGGERNPAPAAAPRERRNRLVLHGGGQRGGHGTCQASTPAPGPRLGIHVTASSSGALPEYGAPAHVAPRQARAGGRTEPQGSRSPGRAAPGPRPDRDQVRGRGRTRGSSGPGGRAGTSAWAGARPGLRQGPGPGPGPRRPGPGQHATWPGARPGQHQGQDQGRDQGRIRGQHRGQDRGPGAGPRPAAGPRPGSGPGRRPGRRPGPRPGPRPGREVSAWCGGGGG